MQLMVALANCLVLPNLRENSMASAVPRGSGQARPISVHGALRRASSNEVSHTPIWATKTNASMGHKHYVQDLRSEATIQMWHCSINGILPSS